MFYQQRPLVQTTTCFTIKPSNGTSDEPVTARVTPVQHVQNQEPSSASASPSGKVLETNLNQHTECKGVSEPQKSAVNIEGRPVSTSELANHVASLGGMILSPVTIEGKGAEKQNKRKRAAQSRKLTVKDDSSTIKKTKTEKSWSDVDHWRLIFQRKIYDKTANPKKKIPSKWITISEILVEEYGMFRTPSSLKNRHRKLSLDPIWKECVALPLSVVKQRLADMGGLPASALLCDEYEEVTEPPVKLEPKKEENFFIGSSLNKKGSTTQQSFFLSSGFTGGNSVLPSLPCYDSTMLRYVGFTKHQFEKLRATTTTTTTAQQVQQKNKNELICASPSSVLTTMLDTSGRGDDDAKTTTDGGQAVPRLSSSSKTINTQQATKSVFNKTTPHLLSSKNCTTIEKYQDSVTATLNAIVDNSDDIVDSWEQGAIPLDLPVDQSKKKLAHIENDDSIGALDSFDLFENADMDEVEQELFMETLTKLNPTPADTTSSKAETALLCHDLFGPVHILVPTQIKTTM